MPAGKAIEFSLEVNETPVYLVNPKNNTREQYVLREPDGTGRDKFLDMVSKVARIDPNTGEVTGVNTLVGVELTLVTECLHRVKADGTVERVTAEFVNSLPARVRTGLFKEAKAISAFDEDGIEAAKNG